MHVHIINIERKSLSERVQIRALQGKIDLINGFQKILPEGPAIFSTLQLIPHWKNISYCVFTLKLMSRLKLVEVLLTSALIGA